MGVILGLKPERFIDLELLRTSQLTTISWQIVACRDKMIPRCPRDSCKISHGVFTPHSSIYSPP